MSHFLAKSGAFAAGTAVFAEPFAWYADASVSPWDSKPDYHWQKQDKDETPLAYLARCRDDAALGLSIGIAQLAIRRTSIPRTIKSSIWTVAGCPHELRDTDVESIVRATGYERPQIVGRPYHNNKGTTWRVRAGLAGEEDYRIVDCGDSKIVIQRSGPAATKERATVDIKTRHWAYNDDQDVAGEGRQPKPGASTPARGTADPGKEGGEGEKKQEAAAKGDDTKKEGYDPMDAENRNEDQGGGAADRSLSQDVAVKDQTDDMDTMTTYAGALRRGLEGPEGSTAKFHKGAGKGTQDPWATPRCPGTRCNRPGSETSLQSKQPGACSDRITAPQQPLRPCPRRRPRGTYVWKCTACDTAFENK